MFKIAGSYKKWRLPNSAHITYARHAILFWHMYLRTYVDTYTAPVRICTTLIGSRSPRSLANKYPVISIAIHLRVSHSLRSPISIYGGTVTNSSSCHTYVMKTELRHCSFMWAELGHCNFMYLPAV